jgi:Uncharacterised nucleotidyltransferase
MALDSAQIRTPSLTRNLKKDDVPKALSREQRIHEAILLSFSSTMPDQVGQLLHLSSSDWQRLLRWLDVGGLALYFLERFNELGLLDTLPRAVVNRLRQNLDDNTQRTRGMVEESIALQQEFQRAGLSYAVMKGISLFPVSVSRPELRHQFDLDYLISEGSAPEARRILERKGYSLYAISGKSWEFKLNETPYFSREDFYKDIPNRAVELHLETETSGPTSRLSRVVYREIFGMPMPVFSPVDLFLGQGLHAFKDICSEFSRAAHLLEFYRHILARYDDAAFWRDLRTAAESDPKASLGIGVVIYLMTTIMGDFAPNALTIWTVGALPASARLWVDLYGRRTVFGKHPGSKLYLLLQRELEAAGVPGRRPIRKSLLPSSLPRAVIRSLSNETISTRIARYRVQAGFLLFRLRFHLVEGARYAIESHRWQQHLDRLPS